MVWAKWSSIAVPKRFGGLGVRDLMSFNKALIGKWAWRAILGKEEMWLEIVRSSIGERSRNPNGLSMLRLSRSVRGWWRDVVSCLEDEKGGWFECNIRRDVGDGESTSFWDETWAGPASLKSLFPRFFYRCLNKTCSVAQAGEWVGDEWVWKVEWRREFRQSDQSSLSDLLGLLESRKNHTTLKDSWKWESDNVGEYSVRRSYSLLMSRKLDINRGQVKLCNLLWRNAAVEKAKATVWRVVFRKIATKTELRRRGALPAHVSVDCALCGEKEETTEHLFFECKPVRDVWGGCLEWIAHSAKENLLQFCSLLDSKDKRVFLATLWICAVWNIWKARNNVIFQPRRVAPRRHYRGD